VLRYVGDLRYSLAPLSADLTRYPSAGDEQCRRMRLMVVGQENVGKSTLLKVLREGANLRNKMVSMFTGKGIRYVSRRCYSFFLGPSDVCECMQSQHGRHRN
jgi:GTPase SAR1 family protein